jgi:hypothetical protein
VIIAFAIAFVFAVFLVAHVGLTPSVQPTHYVADDTTADPDGDGNWT